MAPECAGEHGEPISLPPSSGSWLGTSADMAATSCTSASSSSSWVSRVMPTSAIRRCCKSQANRSGYTLRNDGVKISDDGQKQMATAYISVFEDGKQIDTLLARWFFRKHEQEPTTESLSADRLPKTSTWYLISTASKLGSQSATLQFVINPLVNWIWLGFGIMALGTGIALLPERLFRLPSRSLAQRRLQRRRRCHC